MRSLDHAGHRPARTLTRPGPARPTEPCHRQIVASKATVVAETASFEHSDADRVQEPDRFEHSAIHSDIDRYRRTFDRLNRSDTQVLVAGACPVLDPFTLHRSSLTAPTIFSDTVPTASDSPGPCPNRTGHRPDTSASNVPVRTHETGHRPDISRTSTGTLVRSERPSNHPSHHHRGTEGPMGPRAVSMKRADRTACLSPTSEAPERNRAWPEPVLQLHRQLQDGESSSNSGSFHRRAIHQRGRSQRLSDSARSSNRESSIAGTQAPTHTRVLRVLPSTL